MRLKKVFKVFVYLVFLCFTSLCILELCYRYQLVDFYKFEFKYLNPEVQSPDKRVLIIGDSFSTYPNGYVDLIRQKNPSIEFINTAIPGIGIKQQKVIVENRLKDIQPDEVIYQFYTGNDFLDIQHPVNLKTLSVSRNLFWKLSGHFLVLHYLNYKLSGITASSQTSEQLQNDEFSVKTYNNRVKVNFKGNPDYLQNSLELREEAVESYSIWKDNFEELLQLLPENTTVSIVLVPHCAQVSLRYKNRMEQLGANLKPSINQLSPKLYFEMQKDFPSVLLIDPLKQFQKEENTGNQLYFGNDPHLNPEGQKVLAEYITAQLLHLQ